MLPVLARGVSHDVSRKPSITGFNLFGGIPIRPEQIPLSALEELLGAMTQATEDLFGYIEIWEATKKAKLEAAV